MKNILKPIVKIPPIFLTVYLWRHDFEGITVLYSLTRILGGKRTPFNTFLPRTITTFRVPLNQLDPSNSLDKDKMLRLKVGGKFKFRSLCVTVSAASFMKMLTYHIPPLRKIMFEIWLRKNSNKAATIRPPQEFNPHEINEVLETHKTHNVHRNLL